MADQISLTVDSVEITANPGTNVLQAAIDAGLYIPYLCYYPGMKSFGACRMCVVEIDGQRGTPASCTTPAMDGMVVNTGGAGTVELRKGIMDRLLSEHPHGCLTCHRVDLCGPSDICLRHVSVNDRCVTCPKNERCELKDTVRFLEMDMDTPLTYNNRQLPAADERPVLGDGPQPVHRVRPLRAGLRRGQGRQRPDLHRAGGGATSLALPGACRSWSRAASSAAPA